MSVWSQKREKEQGLEIQHIQDSFRSYGRTMEFFFHDMFVGMFLYGQQSEIAGPKPEDNVPTEMS